MLDIYINHLLTFFSRDIDSKLLTAEPGPIGLYQHVMNLNNYLIYFFVFFQLFPEITESMVLTPKKLTQKVSFSILIFFNK
jgi:hypothetical protein